MEWSKGWPEQKRSDALRLRLPHQPVSAIRFMSSNHMLDGSSVPSARRLKQIVPLCTAWFCDKRKIEFGMVMLLSLVQPSSNTGTWDNAVAGPKRIASKMVSRTSTEVPLQVASVDVRSQARTHFATLPKVRVSNINTGQFVQVNLYDPDGRVEPGAAQELSNLLADTRSRGERFAMPISERLLQLVFRAAYHFGKPEVSVISGYRRQTRRREGYHAQGRAVDLRIPGVTPAALASYFRKIPRLGVGIYSHPKTQFVHIDVREVSFHWLDASPPRRRYREQALVTSGIKALDAAYRSADDLPE